jgi:hypothetical protein
MNVSLGEKINLVDMKKMVQQGEQLCEERKSKELTRAMNVLDTAEEVRRLFCSFSSAHFYHLFSSPLASPVD